MALPIPVLGPILVQLAGLLPRLAVGLDPHLLGHAAAAFVPRQLARLHARLLPDQLALMLGRPLAGLLPRWATRPLRQRPLTPARCLLRQQTILPACTLAGILSRRTRRALIVPVARRCHFLAVRRWLAGFPLRTSMG